MSIKSNAEYEGSFFPLRNLLGICIGSVIILVMVKEITISEGSTIFNYAILCLLDVIVIAYLFRHGLLTVLSGIYIKFRVRQPSAASLRNATGDATITAGALVLLVASVSSYLFTSYNFDEHVALLFLPLIFLNVGLSVISIAWTIRFALTDYTLPERTEAAIKLRKPDGVNGALARPHWGNPEMDQLELGLRAVLAASGVAPEDQSSVLHQLASDIDAVACADGSAN